MIQWERKCPMQVYTNNYYQETWISKDSTGIDKRSYNVNVRLGKPIDILSLKKTVLQDFLAEVEYHKTSRESLFALKNLEVVKTCPICGSSVNKSKFCLSIYGGNYYQCTNCSHCFLLARPSESALNEFYATDTHYSSTYVDKSSLETRVRQVAYPKAEWMIDQFELTYGRKPESVLDVGAGGGHFVYAATQLGLRASGIEASKSSREFCKNNFGIKLDSEDFIKEWSKFSDVDVITFWGLIEHVSSPLNILLTAKKALQGRDSLVISSAPHWDSLSTAVQTLFPQSVVRHLDPLGHPHIFTNSSLATSFELSGFAPVAAWYFGMDVYELSTQLAMSNRGLIDGISGDIISVLQNIIDQGRLSDSIVIAGRPL